MEKYLVDMKLELQPRAAKASQETAQDSLTRSLKWASVKLGIEFNRPSLLYEAMDPSRNSTLAFIGDAVLRYMTTKYVDAQLPSKGWYYLHLKRSVLMSNHYLHYVAQRYDIGFALTAPKTNNPKEYADAIEAVVGAYFLDSGLEKCEQKLMPHLFALAEGFLARLRKTPQSTSIT